MDVGGDAVVMDGHVDSAMDGTPQNCAQAGCAPFQLCDLQAGGDAGICQPGCQPGFDWNATTKTCTQIGGSCGTGADSIAAACTAANRTCQEANGSAMCGGCVSGFVESGSSCVTVTTCADCAARHRDCAQSGGVPSCGACSAGFQETIGGTCAAVPTSCQDGGVDGGGCSFCPSGQGWDPFAGSCHPCLDGVPQRCDGPGETGNIVITEAKDNARCICETRGGFYPDSASNAAQPCDNDGDGWVRESAQPAYESTNAVIHLNARCSVLTVDRIVLQGESGATKEVALAAPLPLYESNRNDGATASGADIVPPYGSGSMPLSTAALNSFTKACVTTTADHNHNGLADVSEWATDANASGPFRSAVAANPKLMAYYQQYSRFSYFVELHNGLYEAVAGAPAGRYHITERSRQSGADPSTAVSLSAPSGTSPYWRSCGRHVDSLYRASTTRSFAAGDFADLQSSGTTDVMVHESQFKCVTVKSSTDYAQGGFDASTSPEVVSVKNGNEIDRKSGSLTVSLPWTPNTCTLASEKAVPGAVPPSLPELSCSVLALSDVVADHAYWMVVGYENAANTAPADYVRGCLNECVEVIPDPGPCNRCDTDNAGHGTVSVRPAATACPAGVCDGSGNCGACVPGTVQCKDATTPQSCSASRVWVDQTACTYGCNAGACYSQCTPNSRQCSGSTPQHCDATGHWVSETACATGFGCVGAGTCQCTDDAYGKSCGAATSLGTIAIGASAVRTGVLPLAASENWFAVTFQSGASSHPKVAISATDMIGFDVIAGACGGSPVTCAETSTPVTQVATWEIMPTGGSASGVGCGSTTLTCNSACNCTTPWSPTPAVGTVFVRVHRTIGSPTCNAYTLTVTD